MTDFWPIFWENLATLFKNPTVVRWVFSEGGVSANTTDTPLQNPKSDSLWDQIMAL